MSGLSSGSRSQLARPAPAAELYHSTRLQWQRRAVERHADLWFGPAAKHGLLTPESVLEPHTGALTGRRLAARVAWAVRVAQPLAPDHNPAAPWLIRAGATDGEPLLPLLTGALHRPPAGRGRGAQIAWPQGELAEKNQQPGDRPASGTGCRAGRPAGWWPGLSPRPQRQPTVVFGCGKMLMIPALPGPRAAASGFLRGAYV